MQCDLIIPAYNDPPALPVALAALKAQTIPSPWRVNIITAGDSQVANAGPGVARNRALQQATGDVIVFLAADIILRPNALARHLEFHIQHPTATAAALGMVKWDPRLNPTPLMEWMVHGGAQNDFDSLLGRSQADPRQFFYASHVSVKRALIKVMRFRNFGPYGWEDLDFGQRLADRGLKLHVLHSAVGLHHHFYSVPAISRRQYLVGQSAPAPTIPSRSRYNHLRRRLFVALGGQYLLQRLLMWTAHKYSTPRLFLHFTATEFWRGVWKKGEPKIA